MSVWIIEGGKLRPTFPECPFYYDKSPHADKICRGQTEPINFNPWECAILIQRAGGSSAECCNDDIQVQCTECKQVACIPCMSKDWINR